MAEDAHKQMTEKLGRALLRLMIGQLLDFPNGGSIAIHAVGRKWVYFTEIWPDGAESVLFKKEMEDFQSTARRQKGKLRIGQEHAYAG